MIMICKRKIPECHAIFIKGYRSHDKKYYFENKQEILDLLLMGNILEENVTFDSKKGIVSWRVFNKNSVLDDKAYVKYVKIHEILVYDPDSGFGVYSDIEKFQKKYELI